jgi:hypothetical protein
VGSASADCVLGRTDTTAGATIVDTFAGCTLLTNVGTLVGADGSLIAKASAPTQGAGVRRKGDLGAFLMMCWATTWNCPNAPNCVGEAEVAANVALRLAKSAGDEADGPMCTGGDTMSAIHRRPGSAVRTERAFLVDARIVHEDRGPSIIQLQMFCNCSGVNDEGSNGRDT